jgi:hypothetical protein
MYYGVDGNEGFVSGDTPIEVPASMTLDQANQFVENLKNATQQHRDKGLRRATFFSQKKPTENPEIYKKINNLNPMGHIENLLDVWAISDLSLSTMPNKTFRIIGERTWVDQNGKVTYLAIAKTDSDKFELVSRLLPCANTQAGSVPVNFNEIRIYLPR